MFCEGMNSARYILFFHQQSWKLDEGIILMFVPEKSAITFVEGCSATSIFLTVCGIFSIEVIFE